MPLAARLVCVALVACAWNAAARSQTPTTVRAPHTGRVFDKDKKPVPNAKVTLVSAGEHGGLDGGDVVRVDADADGRFRAQLQPTRSYVAWATTACDGGFAVCAPVEVGFLPIELIAGTEKAATSFRVTGTAPWLELGPLRVELVLFECPALTVRGELDKDGAIELPPLPGATMVEARVFAKDVIVYTNTSSANGNIALPKPRRIKVRVADDKDQPIAKAVVERVVWRWANASGPFNSRPGAEAFPVATSGDDGTAEVLVALDKDPFENGANLMMTFRVRHEGRASGFSGFSNQVFANGKLIEAKDAKGVLPFVLAAPTATSIKVLANDGQMPAAVQRVGYRTVPYQKNSMTSIVDGECIPVRDGVLLLEKNDDGNEGALELPCQMPPLPAGDAWQRSARPIPLVLPATALDKSELDLRSLLPLRVQVLDRGAGPAIGARVMCSPASGNSFLDPSFAMHARTDRSGRIVLPVLPGSWFVMAVMDDGIAHAVVEASPGLAPQTLQLHAFDRMRVRTVDGAGKPVEGVRFSSNGSSWSGGGSAEDEMLRRVGWQLSSWSLQRCVSDAEGKVDLLFLAARGMQMRLEAMKDRMRASNLRLEAGDDPVDIVLR